MKFHQGLHCFTKYLLGISSTQTVEGYLRKPQCGFLKDIYCPIEIIKGLTDKGQFQYLTNFKGPQEGSPVYNKISFTKIKINIIS